MNCFERCAMEARRSLLFLKSLRRVVFGGIVEKRFDEWACVEAKRTPSQRVRAVRRRCARNERRIRSRLGESNVRSGAMFRCE